MVLIKGHEYKEIIIRNSYNRRAQHYKNRIINDLKIFGITDEDIDITLEKVSMKKAQASASWYMWDEHFYCSYNGASKYVENLAMVTQVIEHSIELLAEGKMSKEEFIAAFAEDIDIDKQRKEARELLEVDENSIDWDEIHKNYKRLSKKHHPDMPDGDTATFQKLNRAHKILKKELC